MNLQRIFLNSTCFILLLVLIEVCSCRSMTGQSYDAQVAKKINDLEADYGVQLTSLEQDEPHKTRRLLALMPDVATDTGDTANAQPISSLEETLISLKKNKSLYLSGNKKNKVSMDVLSPIVKRVNMNVRYRFPRGKYRGRTTYRASEIMKLKVNDNEAYPLKGNETKLAKQTYCSTKEPLPKLDSSYVPTSNETVEDDGNSNSEIEVTIEDNNYLPPEHGHCPKHYIDDP